MSQKSRRMDPAYLYFRGKQLVHRRKYFDDQKIYGDYPNDLAMWTFDDVEKDWEMIRKLTLHMFRRSTVDQLTDAEVILANQIANNITDVIFANIDVIGHSRAEIERRLNERNYIHNWMPCRLHDLYDSVD